MMGDTMSLGDNLTLAQLDYELHTGTWPLSPNVTVEYIGAVHPDRTVDRHLLVDVLVEYIGRFGTTAELARTVTAQSFLGDDLVNLNAWPFSHIDWEAAAVEFEGTSIVTGRRGPIVRVQGDHYFAPGMAA